MLCNICIYNTRRSGKALDCFVLMLREGLLPDKFTFSSVLRAYTGLALLEVGRQVHVHVLKFDVDLIRNNALLDMYCKSGSLEDARLVFKGMVHKDVISWSTMIGGFARNNDGVEALNQCKGMKRAGFTASQATIASVLRACSGLARIEVGRQIHVHVLKFDVDLILNNALLDMYCKSGSLEDAKLVFERLVYKNAISWSTMIGGFAQNNDGHEALSQFKSIKRVGFTADQATLASVLRACTGITLLEVGKQVHVHVLKFDVDLILNSALLDMYCKSGSLEDAKLVFERIVYKNVISWNTMIRGFALNNDGLEALNQFRSMKRAGFTADQATLVSVLRACTGLALLEVKRQVHVHVLMFDANLILNNALLDMYCKSDSLKDARLVFEQMVRKDVISWSTMIAGFALNSEDLEALNRFKSMKRAGFKADQATLTNVLRAYIGLAVLEVGRQVHVYVLKFDVNLILNNALLDMYCKSDSLKDAKLVFERMVHKNVASWNTMIGGFVLNSDDIEALKLFKIMKRVGFTANQATLASVLRACTALALLEVGRQVHVHVLKFDVDLILNNALLDMYCKSGSLEDAKSVFERMVHKYVISWNTMIAGLAQNGFSQEALKLFDLMKASGMIPDSITILWVLFACTHVGLVNDGMFYFRSMKRLYGIDPRREHYGCIIDLLGRAGKLDEAVSWVKELECEADAATWRTLLRACRVHHNVGLAIYAAKQVLKIDPEDALTYVLLFNIYSNSKRWEDVAEIRRQMRDKCIKKERGCSWIEVNKQIHAFISGDAAHLKIKEIS